MEIYFFFKLLLRSFCLITQKIYSKDQKSYNQHSDKIYEIVIHFSIDMLNLFLLMRKDILREFINELIKRIVTKHSIKPSSCLASQFLKQWKINIGHDHIIPHITTYQIIGLSDTKYIKWNMRLLAIGKNLQRIETDIRIAISDQDNNSWLIGFLVSELLKIMYTKQKCIAYRSSQEILYRRKISEIHGL